MDDFSLDRQELTGSLISMEFGPGGRIQQLWTSDPSTPSDSEEFQFVAPPLMMGEETTEDYFPGTILLGARMDPDDPWIVSRNTRAEILEDDESTAVAFEYEFAFLEDLRATGRFYEIPGVVPQIAWDVEIKNRSRHSVEIGELGFPLALNNVMEGFTETDRGVRELWNDRIYVHKFIGGSASYVFAQRLTARPPGLLIYPGENTRWEFFNHVPASLTTPLRWEGIPVVYVHSQAAIEREGWPEWFSGHTSIVLEPGESRTYSMRFAPADRYLVDNVSATLISCGRPTIKLYPSAVAPVDVGIALEVSGTTPTRFTTDIELELETDADEDGGFCFVKPTTEGTVKVKFDDTLDRTSEAHLLFIRPIEELIQKRARWIFDNQIVREEGLLEKAIVPADLTTGQPILDPEAYVGPFGIESSLSEALFLAEKNTIYPVVEQIEAIDAYLEAFVEDALQNPGDGSVGSSLPDLRSVAANFGRPQTYPLVFCLYHSMARVARLGGGTRFDVDHYLQKSARTLVAMFNHSNKSLLETSGIPLMSYALDLVRDLRNQGLKTEADLCTRLLDRRDIELSRRKYPFLSEGQWNTDGFEESFCTARRRGNEDMEERALRCALAARNLAPSWWWYGSDKRWVQDVESVHPGVFDKGELCHGPSSVMDSALIFRTLDRDYNVLPEPTIRLAFGGMLGVWSLVRTDGAASMGFCPDAASKQFGMSGVTGSIGLGLFHYLRNVGAYVLPSRTSGVTTFGCHFEIENNGALDVFVIRPWDGVGRKVVIRQISVEIEADSGQILEVQIDSRKRNAKVTMANHSQSSGVGQFRIRGLWGNVFDVSGTELQSENGELRVVVPIGPGTSVQTEIQVKK